MKRKNDETNWKAIFVDSDGGLHFVWQILFIMAVICTIAALAITIDKQLAQSPMDYYTESYEACMATGQFVQDVCHEIGIGAMGF